MKILVAIPTYDKKVDVEIMSVFAQLPGHYQKHVFAFDFVQSSLISYARNHLVKRFLETDFDWLYFWDADVVIRDVSFIEKLLETAAKMEADIVGLPYRLKSGTGIYGCGVKGEGGAANLTGIRNFEKGELKEPQLIDALTTGSMLIHRKVLESLKDPWFTIVDLPGLKFIPEDFNFCANAQKEGFKIAVDPRIDTFHFGTSFWQHHYETKN
jgi:GT2 family glycosyltransferase